MDFIDQFAQAALDIDYATFLEHFNLLKNSPEEFRKLELDELYDFEVDENDTDFVSIQGLFLLSFALENEHTMMIDWKGEDTPGEFEEFVCQKLKNMNVENIDFSSMEEINDDIEEKFELIGDMLQKSNISLSFLDDGGDCYYPFIIKQEVFDKLDLNAGDSEISISSYQEI